MNDAVMAFGAKHITALTVEGASVLEIGSLDVNGSLRPLVSKFNPKCYVGTDMRPGKGVDVVIKCEDLPGKYAEGSFDFIICTSMLEHAQEWKPCVNVMKRLLKTGGYLLFTAPAPGFHVHEYPGDYWRFTVSDLKTIFSDMDIKDVSTDESAFPNTYLFAQKSMPFIRDLAGVEVWNVSKHGAGMVRKPSMKTKLNICCGQMILDGFINIDSYPSPDVDVVCDARELSYAENSVDEVVMFHAIEHFTLDDACMIIRKLFTMLRPGGTLIIEAPDVFKAVKNAPTGEFDAIKGIFGDIAELRKGKDGYQHKWGWTGALMQQEMASAGFNVSEVTDGISHAHEWRDFRVIGFKPNGVPNGKS
jgi:predicted SAM-dependent methyltransferase